LKVLKTVYEVVLVLVAMVLYPQAALTNMPQLSLILSSSCSRPVNVKTNTTQLTTADSTATVTATWYSYSDDYNYDCNYY